jgi:hypothetical protein
VGRTKVDPETVELMMALLKCAARDLSETEANGLLAAYALGNVR